MTPVVTPSLAGPPGKAPAGRCRRGILDRAGGWKALLAGLLLAGTLPLEGARTLRYFPVGAIYEYRWKLLELALKHAPEAGDPVRLVPYGEEITQGRAVSLLQSGELDVIALGTNPEREANLLPVRIDILKGIVGFRVFLIRGTDQARIARMGETALKEQLVFGLLRDWADLPIMTTNGYRVETATEFPSLFAMLDAGRFDAFPRGINEVHRDMATHRASYPRLAIEQSKALYFPFPIYFWVGKGNQALAAKIQRGLDRAAKDGSFRKLFTAYHAEEIAQLKKQRRLVIRLDNPYLPSGISETDTSWWWKSH
jgi:hypothetical protein